MQGIYQLKNIGVPVNFKNQHDILRGQIIRFNLSTQSYQIRKSGLQLRERGFIPNTKAEKMRSSYVGLSAKGVGNLFNLSAGSGSRIRGKLNKLNQLSVKPVYAVLFENVSLINFKNMRNEFVIPAYSFLKEGRVLVQKRPSMNYTGNLTFP